MSGATEGQAAYETYWGPCCAPEDVAGLAADWRELADFQRANWERAAQAAIDVFLAGDSVSAESIREAIAAQDAQPAPSAGPRDGALDIARGKLRRIAMGWERDPSAGADEALVMIRELLEQPQPAPGLADAMAETKRYRELLDDFTHAVIDARQSVKLAAAAQSVRKKAGLPPVQT